MDHLQDLLDRLPDEGVAYGPLLAPQDRGGLVAECPVGDDGGRRDRGRAGYTSFVHKHLLMGRVPGGASCAGTSCLLRP